MIQGLLFGHIMLDFSQLPELEEDWVDLAMQTIGTMVGANKKFHTLTKSESRK